MDRNVDPRDEWQNRLFKLLPAEFTGLFLAGSSIVDATNIKQDKNIYIFFFILLILLPIFNWRVLTIQRPWKQNLIICASFIIWCLNINLFRIARAYPGQYIESDNLNFWAPVSMGLWLIIVLPLVFRKQNWEDAFFAEKLKKEREVEAIKHDQPSTISSSI
jgi:phosphoglycerol transferase MdoB-like AlkP superfamily enzyme